MQQRRPFHTSVAAEYTRHATSARPRAERAILPILLSPKRCQEYMSTPGVPVLLIELAKNRDCREQTVVQPGASPRSRTRRDRGRSSSECCRTFPASTDSISPQGTDMPNVPAPLVNSGHRKISHIQISMSFMIYYRHGLVLRNRFFRFFGFFLFI
jgi:hypothetical protein